MVERGRCTQPQGRGASSADAFVVPSLGDGAAAGRIRPLCVRQPLRLLLLLRGGTDRPAGAFARLPTFRCVMRRGIRRPVRPLAAAAFVRLLLREPS